MSCQYGSSPRTQHASLVTRQIASVVTTNGYANGFEKGLSSRSAGVHSPPPGRGLPIRYVSQKIPGQGFRCGIALRPTGHIHLAEQDHALAFTVFHQRAVLEAEPAIENRQEISSRWFLNQ